MIDIKKLKAFIKTKGKVQKCTMNEEEVEISFVPDFKSNAMEVFKFVGEITNLLPEYPIISNMHNDDNIFQLTLGILKD